MKQTNFFSTELKEKLTISYMQNWMLKEPFLLWV